MQVFPCKVFVTIPWLLRGTDSLGMTELTYREVARNHKAIYVEQPTLDG